MRDARETWHRRYLDWVESDPARLAEITPETLARHLEGCGRLEEAASRRLEAGLSAEAASASREAAAHFAKCVELRERIGGGAGGETATLQARVLLAGALLSSRGPGSPETRAAYDAALEIADRIPESEWHFPAYWGWWRISDSFATMAARAVRILAASERMEGLEFRLQAHHCVWANSFQRGELATSEASAREGLSLYETGAFEGRGKLYGGHDCKVCALGELALTGWLRGAGDAAAADADAALAHAERLGHLGSVTHALDIMVMLHHYRRDPAAVARTAGRLLALGDEHDLEEYRAKGRIFLGWARVAEGDAPEGLREIEAGFDVMREIGTPEDFPVYQCMRAAALRRMGEVDAALGVLAEGSAVIDAEGVNYWGAEIARQRALAENARAAPDHRFVATWLDEAAGIAASQGALALELRAATDRRLVAGDDASRRTLAAVLGRFDPRGAGPRHRRRARRARGNDGTGAMKAWRDGGRRARPPAETWARLRPLLPVFGITRVGAITGLDRIGVPVFTACRPNARSLSVYQGKGLTEDAARVSAAMEAYETWCAESVDLPLKFASIDDLRYSHRLIDLDRLPMAGPDGPDPGRPFLWIEGTDLMGGGPLWLPFETVHANYASPEPPRSGAWPATTNGLASGNTREEAILHALMEVIERDAVTLWRLRPDAWGGATAVRPGTVSDPAARGLLDRLEAAGIEVGVWDATSDAGAPCFLALIHDPDGTGAAEIGAGAHPSPAVALVRALTEAVQVRATFIAGAREDIPDDDYAADAIAARRATAADILGTLRPERDFAAVADVETDSFAGDVAGALDGLRAVGITQAVGVGIGKPALPFPVVRVVVPGLEGAFDGGEAGWEPGPRAARVLEAAE